MPIVLYQWNFHISCREDLLPILIFLISECNCNEEGSKTFICDKDTGKCTCNSNLITGDKCDKSIDGYFGFPAPQGEYIIVQ